MSIFNQGIGAHPILTASADSPEYWDELAERHAEHRRHVIGLAISGALLLVGGFVVHSSLAVLALLLIPFLALELFMVRQSRPTMKIPDYRRSPTVEVELDPIPEADSRRD